MYKDNPAGLSRRTLLKGVTAMVPTMAPALAISVTGCASVAPTASPPGNTDIVDLTALELSKAIHTKKLSAVEVMQAHLKQINQHNQAVNAIVSLRDESLLLEEAKRCDAELAAGKNRGWMHGMPHAVKDLANAKGLPTTSGSPILANNVASQDTIYVARIKAAGAIVIGKTNVPEFGLGSQTYNTVFGATGNAWDHSKTAGGSSGGAATALAMRMLPVADGSDFMGSLRNPAGFNNVIGFRPTPGRVPLSQSFIEELPCNGPMARNVSDTAMLLSTMAGHHPNSPTSLPGDPSQFAKSLAANWSKSRIAWLGDFDGYLPTEPGVMSLCESALQGFRDIGCSVDSARPDYDMAQLWETWLVLRHWLTLNRARSLYTNPVTRKQLKPEAIWEIEGGMNYTGEDVARASNARGAWYQALAALFERYDFLVLPTAQVFPFDHNTPWPKQINGRNMDTYHRWMEVVIPGTLSGCPVINVPAGFSAQGLPMGLQIIAKRYADLDALKIAYAYEQVTRWNLDRRPPALSKNDNHG